MTNKKPTVEEMIFEIEDYIAGNMPIDDDTEVDWMGFTKFLRSKLELTSQAAREEERQEIITWICKRLNCTPDNVISASYPGTSKIDDLTLAINFCELIALINNHDHITTNS